MCQETTTNGGSSLQLQQKRHTITFYALFIGGNACCAKCWYLSYLGRFWGLVPWKGDMLHQWDEIWCDVTVLDPKRKNVIILKPNFEINAPKDFVPCTTFTKSAELVGCFTVDQMLQFGWICSTDFGSIGLRDRIAPHFSTPKWKNYSPTPKHF